MSGLPRDLPFPRISAFGYWCFLLGGIFLCGSIFFNAAPRGGWFMYPPLTSSYQSGIGADIWLLGFSFIEIAAIAAAVELIVGVLKCRPPGMRINLIPLYCWYTLVAAGMVLFAFPPLIAGSMLLEIERAFHWPFFNPAGGGDIKQAPSRGEKQSRNAASQTSASHRVSIAMALGLSARTPLIRRSPDSTPITWFSSSSFSKKAIAAAPRTLTFMRPVAARLKPEQMRDVASTSNRCGHRNRKPLGRTPLLSAAPLRPYFPSGVFLLEATREAGNAQKHSKA